MKLTCHYLFFSIRIERTVRKIWNENHPFQRDLQEDESRIAWGVLRTDWLQDRHHLPQPVQTDQHVRSVTPRLPALPGECFTSLLTWPSGKLTFDCRKIYKNCHFFQQNCQCHINFAWLSIVWTIFQVFKCDHQPNNKLQ